MLTLKGTPRTMDPHLRPVLLRVAWLVGGAGSTLLAYLGAWWWVPVPISLTLLGFEGWTWSRRDQPCVLTLDHDQITVYDPLKGEGFSVPMEAIHSATWYHRQAPDSPDHQECVILLASAEAVLLALPFRFPAGTVPAAPTDVDVDLADSLLGGIAGLIRAIAPRDRLFRQSLTDPKGLAWLRLHLPAHTQGRTSARAWRGAAPPLDLFGYHEGDADVHLVLDAQGLTSHPGVPPHTGWPSGPLHMYRSERTATLLTQQDRQLMQLTEDLPLWCIALGEGLTVAIPAPAVDPDLPERPATEDLLHVHGPEGAAILWHLARVLPDRSLPAAILAVLREEGADPPPAEGSGPPTP